MELKGLRGMQKNRKIQITEEEGEGTVMSAEREGGGGGGVGG